MESKRQAHDGESIHSNPFDFKCIFQNSFNFKKLVRIDINKYSLLNKSFQIINCSDEK